MTEERRVTIYVLRDPRYEDDVDAIRYVGQTRQRLGDRLNNHMVSGRKPQKYRTPRRMWLAELIVLGMRPQIVAVERIPESEGDAAECKWIKFYAAAGCRLANIMDGGKSHQWINDEARSLVGAGIRVTWADPTLRADRSAEMKGRWQDPEYRSNALNGEGRSRVNLATVASWQDPERRAKRIGAIRDAKQTDASKQEQSQRSRALWTDPAYQRKTVSRMTAARNTEESKAKTGKRQKALWADPEWRERMCQKIKAGWVTRRQKTMEAKACLSA